MLNPINGPPFLTNQVWELDRKLLQGHALPLVVGYTRETATSMAALNMDDGAPPDAALRGEAPGGALERCCGRAGFLLDWRAGLKRGVPGKWIRGCAVVE